MERRTGGTEFRETHLHVPVRSKEPSWHILEGIYVGFERVIPEDSAFRCLEVLLQHTRHSGRYHIRARNNATSVQRVLRAKRRVETMRTSNYASPVAG